MWMFCEGLYLHHMIAVTFPGEWHPAYFYLIGWGESLVPYYDISTHQPQMYCIQGDHSYFVICPLLWQSGRVTALHAVVLGSILGRFLIKIILGGMVEQNLNRQFLFQIYLG